jgi:hypothetical protein
MIHVPILAVNTDKNIWGEDATEFKCVLKNKVALEAGGVDSLLLQARAMGERSRFR